jgi:hypothetical protein
MQDADLAGLEDIPDFWDVGVDDEDEGPKTTPQTCLGSFSRSYPQDLLNPTPRENNPWEI